MTADTTVHRFVRAVLAGVETGIAPDGTVTAGHGAAAPSLRAGAVQQLIDRGVLVSLPDGYRAGPNARQWLRDRKLDPVSGGGHREANAPAAPQVNLDESPLSRLAVAHKGEGEPFLAPHQIEAGERIRRLGEKGRMQPRMTLSYDPNRTPGARGNGAGEITESAAQARLQLNRLIAGLPRDCAGVVMDVCLFGKGLQTVEAERGWPRRSAKLVLRIGLEQAAILLGLGEAAVGAQSGRPQRWMGEGARPTEFY